MMAVGKLSGAVGTYSNIDPFVENMSAKSWSSLRYAWQLRLSNVTVMHIS